MGRMPDVSTQGSIVWDRKYMGPPHDLLYQLTSKLKHPTREHEISFTHRHQTAMLFPGSQT